MELIFNRRFSMAHRLYNTGGKCAHVHGHNEVVDVVMWPQGIYDQQKGMVLDFSQAKGLWHSFIDNRVDHGLQLADNDPLIDYFKVNESEKLARLMVTPGDPTTEVTTALLICKLEAILKANKIPAGVHKLTIIETPTNSVSMSVNHDWMHLDVYRKMGTKCWWNRPDDSMHDLYSPDYMDAYLNYDQV